MDMKRLNKCEADCIANDLAGAEACAVYCA